MGNFENRIMKIDLTKTESKIADYFFKNINNVCFKTVTTIAQEIGVSDTSIIRFSRTIGYTSFVEFQKDLQEELISNLETIITPATKYKKKIASLADDNLIGRVLTNSINNIQSTFSNLSLEYLDKAAKIIVESNKKLLVAFRSTSSLAFYMSTKLKYLVHSVHLSTHADGDLIENLIEIREGDCLLVYSFASYSTGVPISIDVAKQKGAKIILLTDTLTTPFAKKADLIFPITIESIGFWNDYTAASVFNDLLLAAISLIVAPGVEDRIKEMSDLLVKYGVQ